MNTTDTQFALQLQGFFVKKKSEQLRKISEELVKRKYRGYSWQEETPSIRSDFILFFFFIMVCKDIKH